jgi:3-isopropylmalate dehydrogenase
MKRIAVLAGDGIGPEVMQQALRVLAVVANKVGFAYELKEALIGGAAYEAYKNHLSEETLEVCKNSDAILFGSVGGPLAESTLQKWKNCEVNSLLGIRKAFSFYANFRPCRLYKDLLDICPLKDSVVGSGASILIIRELIGDIYFGAKTKGTGEFGRFATDMAEYNEQQISLIAKVAFASARNRRLKVTSVDKANVLESSKLWREVVTEVSAAYPDVELEHMLVDNCAMQLVKNPSHFDVLLTTNMFGDILSDLASVLPGSLGMTPSASLNASGFGLYEPSGGSAPDLAGKGVANPTAQILSLAMMLRLSFGLESAAALIENAIEKTIAQGDRTADICVQGQLALGTEEFSDRVIENLNV